MNTPVQGLAADCLKLAMGRLVKTLADKPYIRPVMTVHDSLVFEVRADHVDEAAWKPCRRLRTLRRWWRKSPLGKGTVSWNEYS